MGIHDAPTPGHLARNSAYEDGSRGTFDTLEDKIEHFMRMRPGIWTRRELAHELNMLTSTMSGRITKMIYDGVVRETGKVQCGQSGRKVSGLVLA